MSAWVGNACCLHGFKSKQRIKLAKLNKPMVERYVLHLPIPKFREEMWPGMW